MSDDVSPKTSKELARRFLEGLWSTGDDALIDEIVAPDLVFTLAAKPFRVDGRESFRELVHRMRVAFPDLTYRVVDLIAESDRAACRWLMYATHRATWLGFPARGRHVAIKGMTFFRIADGQIAECEVQNEVLSLLVQLGVVPDPWA